jgi:3-mercaptopyruvate sulfurtransferase SseA
LPHALPTAEVFTEHVRRMRVRRTDQIVCYDGVGMFSVARCAWMFRYFGAENVRILNGGLKKWLTEGKPTHAGDYVEGEGLPEGGDYDYRVVNDTMGVTDINEVHKHAYYLVNKATES